MKNFKILAIVLGLFFPLSVFSQPGTLDHSFSPPTSLSDVWSSYIQSDGKVLVGQFQGLARLNVDGSIDPGFIPSGTTGGAVISISEQADGKFIVAGGFPFWHGVPNRSLIRLESNGAKDNSFTSGIANTSGQAIYATAIQPDQKIIIAGAFTTYNGVSANKIARLNPDGSLDATFNSGIGANNTIRTIALQPDGKILIGGIFNYYNGVLSKYIARLNSDGSLDQSFNAGNSGFPGSNAHVNTIALQTDGKIMVGGSFWSYNGTGRYNILRLSSTGALDITFDPGTGAGYPYASSVSAMKIDSNDRILIGGSFKYYNSTPRMHIARINSDGSLDNSFNVGSGANGLIKTINIQADGKVIIGGGSGGPYQPTFDKYNGQIVHKIARLHGDNPPSISHTTSHYNGYEVSCHGGSNGSIDLTVTDGTPPYTYSWNNGAYTTEDLDSIPAGNYDVTVTDANNSTAEATIILSEPTAINIFLSGYQVDPYINPWQIFSISCTGDSTGTINSYVWGGVGPYTFDWNNGQYATQYLTGLTAGEYTLVATDANGCSASSSATLTEPPTPPLDLLASNDTFVLHGIPNPNECVTLNATAIDGYAPDGLYSYRLKLNGHPIQYVYAATAEFVVCPLSDTYYTIDAVDLAGCVKSKVILVKSYNISCGNNYDKVKVCINGNQTICLKQNAASKMVANNPNAQYGDCSILSKRGGVEVISAEETALTVYPNPSSGIVQVSFDSDVAVRGIAISDITGRSMHTHLFDEAIQQSSTALDLSKYSNGTYIISLMGDGTIIKNYRLVLTK